ncbi:bifunctional 3,4-dihydroxy-2-butanone-4-phosphate synthase/GTP cyclohydrolase II [Chrysiogenes arsenatis]|uniref:bifunctional 3,4-dihydroxy-2-butanone-4-phosphate synthase/GTP cyclohydrolase II n=1 Tax=Chrysiogenes arsenatis TaxID=309797 RepID=UPI000416B806|nr:bifunctional 3,4-dihydroxy-2-butanone-4-phosphate synthase/GTP cyclohydrolase II [Chrysiogenes arsenatis]
MSGNQQRFDSIVDAINDIRQGKMVILVDDEDRENEGDLVCAADKVTPEIINFMATHGRGLICLSLTEQKCDELKLRPMADDNDCRFGTAFMTSIEAKHGVTTGISASDRARTILAAVDPQCKPNDLARPGHMFPLRARNGGVLQRTGQTEGSVDLARLAGLTPAGVICEIMKDDGTMARYPELREFADRFDMKLVTIKDLISYRVHVMKEFSVERIATANLPTSHGGDFSLVGYRSKIDGTEHVALIKGDVAGIDPVLVRVHSQCLTGDVFGSLRCDCGNQLQEAMKIIDKAGKGVILYLFQEGRGIGLMNKIRAYHLQDEGYDTVEANEALGFPDDLRDYGMGAQIIADLGIRRIRLMTNNPRKIIGLAGYGLEVSERVPMQTGSCEHNERYLGTKKDKLGHILG